jgi:hypothetical protein
MRSKKYTRKISRRRNKKGSGPTTDELNKMERGPDNNKDEYEIMEEGESKPYSIKQKSLATIQPPIIQRSTDQEIEEAHRNEDADLGPMQNQQQNANVEDGRVIQKHYDATATTTSYEGVDEGPIEFGGKRKKSRTKKHRKHNKKTKKSKKSNKKHSKKRI